MNEQPILNRQAAEPSSGKNLEVRR
jgi:hypothetical protein